MTDLAELLDRAAEPAAAHVVPVDSDIARGRAALRRRRAGMAGGVCAAALLVSGAGGFVITRSAATPERVAPAAASHPTTTARSPHPARARTAAPFRGSLGARPFELHYVPPGWKVQGWTPESLVLVHTDGSPHTTVQDFEGKIAIESAAQPLPQTGIVRTLDGKRFRVTTLRSADGSPTPVIGSLTPSYGKGYLVVQGTTGADAAELLKIAAGTVPAGHDGSPALG
ncbi:hypothetical protein [Flexivirga caeni]|uniref:DUF4245 domain-containing protein n=1 Tax=Flexivirga caeni TaxID=2294115 RepID=A0A3M9MCB3_9MICO|nr:hypothetical protein [Flexivirga caeni]RNI23202.1 hypothetical protein EFY87_07140 [Flexivirga caeni]